MLVQAYAVADEVFVGAGGSHDDAVDVRVVSPSVVADAYSGEHAAYGGNTCQQQAVFFTLVSCDGDAFLEDVGI